MIQDLELSLEEKLDKYDKYIAKVVADNKEEREEKQLLNQKQNTEKVILYLKYFVPLVEKDISKALIEGKYRSDGISVPECLQQYYFGMDDLKLPNGFDIKNPFNDVKNAFLSKKYQIYFSVTIPESDSKDIKLIAEWYKS